MITSVCKWQPIVMGLQYQLLLLMKTVVVKTLTPFIITQLQNQVLFMFTHLNLKAD